MIRKDHFPGILYFILVIAIVLGMNQLNGLVIGDYLLSKVGIDTRTNGYQIVGIMSITLALSALLGIIYLSKNARSVLPTLALVTFFLGQFVFAFIFDAGYSVIKAKSRDLYSISYHSKYGNAIVRGDIDDEYIYVNPVFFLENHSDDPREFYIKLDLNNHILGRFVIEKEGIAINQETGKPYLYRLGPNTIEGLNGYFVFTKDKQYNLNSGTFSNLDIIIFNEKMEKSFWNPNKYRE